MSGRSLLSNLGVVGLALIVHPICISICLLEKFLENLQRGWCSHSMEPLTQGEYAVVSILFILNLQERALISFEQKFFPLSVKAIFGLENIHKSFFRKASDTFSAV